MFVTLVIQEKGSAYSFSPVLDTTYFLQVLTYSNHQMANFHLKLFDRIALLKCWTKSLYITFIAINVIWQVAYSDICDLIMAIFYCILTHTP